MRGAATRRKHRMYSARVEIVVQEPGPCLSSAHRSCTRHLPLIARALLAVRAPSASAASASAAPEVGLAADARAAQKRCRELMSKTADPSVLSTLQVHLPTLLLP